MTNFNAEDFDNTINPYMLSEEEQAEIMETVGDNRLTNPPGDYFRLELESKTLDIPKLEYISKKTADGKISRLPTIDHIRQMIDK